MNYLLNLASAVSPTPDQEDGLRPGLDPAQVTPGLLGFLATLVLVVAVIFLVRDMSRRIRRVRYQSVADDDTSDGSVPKDPTRNGTAADRTEMLLDDDSSDASAVNNSAVNNSAVNNETVDGGTAGNGTPGSSDTRPGSTPLDR